MKRQALALTLVTALFLPACGQPSGPAESISVADGAARTATFETVKAQILSERRATKTAVALTRPSPTPTVALVATEVVVPDATTAPEPTPDPVPPAFAVYLPDRSLIPDTLQSGRDEELTAEVIAGTWPDTTAHLEQLASWGFQNAWIREFRYPDMVRPPAQQVFWVRTVTVAYGSAEQARAANEFEQMQNMESNSVDYTVAEIAPIGEHVLAMSGPALMSVGMYQAWIWVQDGATSIQYLAGATDVDPLPALEAIVRATFDGAAGP